MTTPHTEDNYQGDAALDAQTYSDMVPEFLAQSVERENALGVPGMVIPLPTDDGKETEIPQRHLQVVPDSEDPTKFYALDDRIDPDISAEDKIGKFKKMISTAREHKKGIAATAAVVGVFSAGILVRSIRNARYPKKK